MEWAKVHTDILGDPKLMRAARKGYKGLELTPWLITFAKKAKDGGRLTVGGEPVEPADLVPLIPGQTARSIAVALESLQALSILARDSDGGLRFTTWEIRQNQRPSDSPEAVRERVRLHRERQRLASSNARVGNDGNALPVTGSNATEERREDQEESRGDTPPHSPTVKLREALPEQYRPDLDDLLAQVPNPTAWVGELTMTVEGGTAGAAVSYEDLGRAIRDFKVNGKAETPEIALFRAYVKRASTDRRRTARGLGPAHPPTGNKIRSVV